MGENNKSWMKDKCFVLTGGYSDEGDEEISSIICEGGGYLEHKVTPETDYLIWYPSFFGETIKLKQAQQFNGQGANIQIYSLDEFLCLLNGEPVESNIVQRRDTIDHIAGYLAKTAPATVERYLEENGMTRPDCQWTLLELLKSYNCTSMLLQRRWCEKICETSGLIYPLYKAAALYFARIHELGKAEELRQQLQSAALASNKSSTAIENDLSYLQGKIALYKKVHYWPKNAQQRLDLAKIYDAAGIPHPMVDEYGNVLGKKDMRSFAYSAEPLEEEKIEELRAAISNTDYTSDEDSKYSAFVSSSAFNIAGIGEKTIHTLLDIGLVQSYGDIFRLKEHKEELLASKLFTVNTIDRMLDSIEKSREISDIKFLTALHIPGISDYFARSILKEYDIHTLLVMGEAQEDLYQLTAAEGIGSQLSAQFFLWFENDANTEVLKDLMQEITIREENKAETGSRCARLTFVTTGKVFIFKNRDALKQYVYSQGGVFSETIN